MGASDLKAERGTGLPGMGLRARQHEGDIVGIDLKIPAIKFDLHLVQVILLVKIGQKYFQRGRLAAGLEADVPPGLVGQGAEEVIGLPAIHDRFFGRRIHYRKVETRTARRAFFILFFHTMIGFPELLGPAQRSYWQGPKFENR